MHLDEQEDAPEGNWELIPDTFEPRRQAIITEFTSGDEKYDEPDEHIEYDYEALKSLQRPILALLQYKPDTRATVKDAMEMIEWIDYRREEEGDNDHSESDEEDVKEVQGEDTYRGNQFGANEN